MTIPSEELWRKRLERATAPAQAAGRDARGASEIAAGDANSAADRSSDEPLAPAASDPEEQKLRESWLALTDLLDQVAPADSQRLVTPVQLERGASVAPVSRSSTGRGRAAQGVGARGAMMSSPWFRGALAAAAVVALVGVFWAGERLAVLIVASWSGRPGAGDSAVETNDFKAWPSSHDLAAAGPALQPSSPGDPNGPGWRGVGESGGGGAGGVSPWSDPASAWDDSFDESLGQVHDALVSLGGHSRAAAGNVELWQESLQQLRAELDDGPL